MVPDKFNMVDMGGIDLILMQGEEVPGLYNRLVESIAQCRYQCLYNWLFDGVIIPPTYVEMEVGLDEEVRINEGVVVTPDDVIHIYSIEPPAPEPEIIPLLAEENGVYYIPEGVDGFNPVTVDVPSYTPVINPLSITENGTYTAPTGVDGYSPITVNVTAGPSLPSEYQEVEYVSMVIGQYAVFPTSISFQVADVFFTRASRMSGTNEQAPWGVHSNDSLSSGLFEVFFASGAASSGLSIYGTNFVKAADYEVAQTGSPNSNSAYLNTAKTGYLAIGKYRNYGLNGNVYVFRVYRSNSSLKSIPFLDFVPCYRKADGEIGFYETVTGTFLTNAGTGEFGKGPDVN